MTASGTTTFLPNFAELMDEAFERAGLDPSKTTSRHIRSAMRSMNLMLTAWAARGVRQWKINQEVQALTANVATYNLAVGTLDIQEAMFREPGTDGGLDIDTRMVRLTHKDYFEIPEKGLTSSICSKFLINRDRDTPTITVWPIPSSSDNQIVCLQLARINDAGNMVNTPDTPFYWFDALAAGWSARISQKFNYARYQDLKLEAEEAFLFATTEDKEKVGVTFSYQCGGQE